jgi:type I restriction enzyme S subunit
VSVPAYFEYKDSVVPWLGRVPSHWPVVQSRRYFALRKDRASGGDRQLTASQKWGVIYQNDFMKLEGQKVVQVILNADILKKVEPNDFVISMRSFQGGIEWCGLNGSISSAYVMLIPNEKVNAFFFRYLFKSRGYIQALQSTSNLVRDGQALRYENFVQVPLPMPPDDEQSAIAAFLDRETAKIDTLVAEQKRLIALLKEKRQAVISRAVTKGLNPNAPMKDSGIEWLGEIPAHWKCLGVRHLAYVLRGKFTHRPRNDPAYYDGEHPFIQTGDITGAGRFITTYKQTLNDLGASVSKLFPAGTLVMAIAANIGDVAILEFPAYFPDSIVGLVPKTGMSLNFLFYLMQAMKQPMLMTATVSTQMNLNVDQIVSMIAVLPPLDEQASIIEYLDFQMDRIDGLVKEARGVTHLLKERRAALISAAVTGKIDVRGLVEQNEMEAA